MKETLKMSSTSASGLTLFKDLYIQILTLLKIDMQTSSPHSTQKFPQNISKPIVIESIMQ